MVPHRKGVIEGGSEVCFLDQRKKRARGRFDQIRQLEGRIDYLEGMIYQLFQLTEKLLEAVERLNDNETPRTSTHTELIAFMMVMACS
jgi:TolA-binding protein